LTAILASYAPINYKPHCPHLGHIWGYGRGFACPICGAAVGISLTTSCIYFKEKSLLTPYNVSPACDNVSNPPR